MGRNPDLASLMLTQGVPEKPVSKQEEGIKVLQRIFKRHLRRNFDYLQMGSIDYKRSLMIKSQQDKFMKMRAIEQLNSRLRVHLVVAKTKAFCRWREASKDFSSQLTYGSQENSQYPYVQELLGQIEQLKAKQS